MVDFSRLRIGFAPMDNRLGHPFDLRNFLYFAKKRGVNFELADPNRDYDIIVVSPRSDLSIWSRYNGKGKIIFFTVDSYLAIPPYDIKGALRGLAKFIAGEHKHPMLNYSKGIQEMCLNSDAVVCSTLEQKNTILKYCKNVHVILEFNFRIAEDTKIDYSIGKCVNLVWEGQAENVSGFKQIKDVLLDLSKKYPIALHLITDLERKKYMNKFRRSSTLDEVRKIFGKSYFSNTASGRGLPVYLYQWNLEMVSRIITGCDIAVIPLDVHNPLMCGKPENKLVLFWRIGMPTLVSLTPAYQRAMARCGLALSCSNKEEWRSKLEQLIVDSEVRKNTGIKGKACADSAYGENEYLKQWDNLFNSVLNG